VVVSADTIGRAGFAVERQAEEPAFTAEVHILDADVSVDLPRADLDEVAVVGEDLIDRSAALDVVRSGAAFQSIRAVFAVEAIGVFIAEELVRVGAAVQRVRSHFAGAGIIPRATINVVISRSAEDLVVVGFHVEDRRKLGDDSADTDGLGNDVGEIKFGLSDQPADHAAAQHPTAEGAGARRDVKEALADHGSASQIRGAALGDGFHELAGVAVEIVVASPAADHIVAGITADRVVASAAGQGIASAAAADVGSSRARENGGRHGHRVISALGADGDRLYVRLVERGRRAIVRDGNESAALLNGNDVGGVGAFDPQGPADGVEADGHHSAIFKGMKVLVGHRLAPLPASKSPRVPNQRWPNATGADALKRSTRNCIRYRPNLRAKPECSRAA
jgi:hypothetical protein